ncbi:DUF2528 family protein [Burkholderia cepacia]|uniref:DUF2528 family protein n=1 Tax=Burkholderia cepacia TaxID=292 RepID=UPI0026E06C2B|nr:DUF2528 family protein [Burkholderia cepacia]MDO5940605.1 DUF2528 family protein [Burkholderia cepacia]
MANIKQYVLTHDFSYEIVVDVDHDILTEAKLVELEMFWGDGEARIAQFGPLNAFLRRFAARFFAESVSSLAPKALFNAGRIEGFPAVDGSAGLLVRSYDEFEFTAEDVDVLEI